MLETDPRIKPEILLQFAVPYLEAMGCKPHIAVEVAHHLIDAELCGVYSHGIFRLVPYAEKALAGLYHVGAEPFWRQADGGAALVDGGNGLGISAFLMAVDEAIKRAKSSGMAAIAVVNVDHTGRIGDFAARAARAGCLSIIFGGGSRKNWRQVAPYGGSKGVLPTNPYAFAIPADGPDPVVIDFATSSGAGGKVFAAKQAGRDLPEGLCIDAHGRPTVNPDDYINGGALLPMAGPKGYGMALVAELLGEALLGQAQDGMNWICICIDMGNYRDAAAYKFAAEDCLNELRSCPPAPGFDRVEIPGEREFELRKQRMALGIPIPPATIEALCAMARQLQLPDELIALLDIQ